MDENNKLYFIIRKKNKKFKFKQESQKKKYI